MKTLIELAFYPAYIYLFVVLLDLGIALRNSQLHLIGDCLGDLLTCAIVIVVLMLIQRCTRPTVFIHKR